MPETTVQAIVLRRRDSGESDRRLTLLTFELGKIDAVAKGARKAASRLAGISDPLSVGVLGIAEGKVNRFVTQAQPLSSFRGLRTDYERLSFGLALVELYAAVLPHEQPFPEAYDLLTESLRHLEKHPKPLVALLWAEAKLLEISGFMPQFDRCVATGELLAEANPFVSPSAGGYVTDSAASPFVDRFRTRAEALYGLARLPDLEAPPPNMKFGDEALADLLPFWRAIAEAPLPANESVVRETRHIVS
jgi:DNA repair protein RecO (recombination protein O)